MFVDSINVFVPLVVSAAIIDGTYFLADQFIFFYIYFQGAEDELNFLFKSGHV